MKKKTALLLLLCIILCSCGKKQVKNTSEAEVLRVMLEENCIDTLFFRSVELVALETHEKSHISSIDRIIADEDMLFLFDRKLRSVFLFETSGKHIATINQVGSGPGEYVVLYDVCIDSSSKQLILLADAPSKLLYYNYSGEFLFEKLIKEKNSIKEVSHTNHHLVAIHDAKEGGCYLNTMDEKSLASKCIMNETNSLSNPVFPKGNFLTSSSDGVYFTKRYDNSIYKWADDVVNKMYSIDFEKFNLPEKYMNDSSYQDELMSVCRKNDYVYSIINVHENSQYLAFKTNLPGFYLYAKKEKELKKYSFVFNSHYEIYASRMMNIDNSSHSIAFLVEPTYLHMIKENSKELKRELSELLDQVEEDDNTLLMICEFK